MKLNRKKLRRLISEIAGAANLTSLGAMTAIELVNQMPNQLTSDQIKQFLRSMSMGFADHIDIDPIVFNRGWKLWKAEHGDAIVDLFYLALEASGTELPDHSFSEKYGDIKKPQG